MALTEEYVELGDATLWTTQQGRGPALVLCHGGPGLWDYLAPVATMIADLATVYRYDQRACGRSSGGPPFDVASAITDLEALRVHWGITEWIVSGHSWGASLALLYCLAYPTRTRALISISGTGTGFGQLFLTTAGMIGVLDSALVGVFVALLLNTLVTHSLAAVTACGLVVFAASVALHLMYQRAAFLRMNRDNPPRFPSPRDSDSAASGDITPPTAH